MSIADKMEIKKKIQKLRFHLISVGMKKGLTHPDTIQVSQNLDKLLNEYGKK
ncbi:MAG: aspartyl-phosphate phosphatase Spo0E family protein [Solibacillus sp.]